MRTEIVEHDPACEPQVNAEALDALRTLALAVAFWRNWWMPILCGGMVIGAGIAIGVLKLAGGAP